MPPESEVLPLTGLVEVVPEVRPSAEPDEASSVADWIAFHFYRLADRTGRERDEMLDRLGCDGVATEETKQRSLAFLSTADLLTEHLAEEETAAADLREAVDHRLEFLLEVWWVVRRRPEDFSKLLHRGQPSIETLLQGDDLGGATRALQLSDEFTERLRAGARD